MRLDCAIITIVTPAQRIRLKEMNFAWILFSIHKFDQLVEYYDNPISNFFFFKSQCAGTKVQNTVTQRKER